MPRLREHKKTLRRWLVSDQWQDHVSDIVHMETREATGPLLSFLLLGGDMTHRAAFALGQSVAKLAEKDKEGARNIMRRLMWHMNEESGNIGWGIPEAFAEILVHSAPLAKEFHSILLSYIMDTGRDDNYCDHALLRVSCHWAVGRFARVRPELCGRALPWLLHALRDAHIPCRGVAAWAIGQCALAKKDMLPLFDTHAAVRAVAHDAAGDDISCYIFEDMRVHEKSVTLLAKETLALL